VSGDPQWRRWEARVNELLGLQPTPASGARWHAIGDGADNDPDSRFALMVDCKATERVSFSLRARDLAQWVRRAAECGRRFAMPIRFHGGPHPGDYILLEINDFAELLELARKN